MFTKEKIQEVSKELTPFFNARTQIQLVYLFGSALEDTSYHDVDFAVWCDEKFAQSAGAFSRVLRWGSELEPLLKPRKPVDLRFLNDAPVHFRHEVICSGVVIFEREHDMRVLFEWRVMTEYGDYEPTRRFFNEYLLSGG